MHLRLDLRKALTVLNIVALVIIFAYAAKAFVVPALARFYYKDEYKELVFQCDNVMRDHFIAKSQALAVPSDQTMRTLRAAEVGLLTCHDYDVLRKRLVVFGVDESQLSELGLEAIEEKANDIRAFVQTHEIRY